MKFGVVAAIALFAQEVSGSTLALLGSSSSIVFDKDQGTEQTVTTGTFDTIHTRLDSLESWKSGIDVWKGGIESFKTSTSASINGTSTKIHISCLVF